MRGQLISSTIENLSLCFVTSNKLIDIFIMGAARGFAGLPSIRGAGPRYSGLRSDGYRWEAVLAAAGGRNRQSQHDRWFDVRMSGR